MDDDPIWLVVEIPVRGDEAALDVEERAAHAQVVGLSEGPEPDQDGGHVFIALGGEEVLDPVCGYRGLYGTWQPACGWFKIHQKQSHEASQYESAEQKGS